MSQKHSKGNFFPSVAFYPLPPSPSIFFSIQETAEPAPGTTQKSIFDRLYKESILSRIRPVVLSLTTSPP